MSQIKQSLQQRATFQTEDVLTEKRTGGEFKTAAAFWAWRKEQKDSWAAFQKLMKVKLPGDSPEGFLARMPKLTHMSFLSRPPSLPTIGRRCHTGKRADDRRRPRRDGRRPGTGAGSAP